MGLARIGTDTQLMVSGPLKVFATDEIDMGEPLHSFVLCGEMHEIEEQMYELLHYTKREAQIEEHKS